MKQRIELSKALYVIVMIIAYAVAIGVD